MKLAERAPEANNIFTVLAPVLKLAGGHKLLDSQMEGRWLQVLPKCHYVHALHVTDICQGHTLVDQKDQTPGFSDACHPNEIG